jgi:hypothetical protein
VLKGFFTLNLCVSVFDLFLLSYFTNKWYQSFILVICVLGFPVGARISTTMKYDLLLMDFDTQFSLWQVKMRAVLAHHDLYDALEGFEKKDRKAWTLDEVRKDHKACP